MERSSKFNQKPIYGTRRLKDTASASAGGDRRNKAENSAENSSVTQATVRRNSVNDANSEDATSEADAVTEGENPSDLSKKL